MVSVNPLYSLGGAVIGVLVGLTGVGGGSLMTPLLVLAFGFHPVTAVGTDLLYAAATKTVGTAVHGWRGTISWPVVGRLALGSVPATALTLLLMTRAGVAGGGDSRVITVTLGLALIATALAILFRRVILRHLTVLLHRAPASPITPLTILLGAVMGVVVSLSSVGAGALGMTALLVLYPDLPTKRLVGSDIAHAVPLTLIAGTGHWLMGTVDVALLVALLIGSVPGIVVGSLLATRVSDRVLRPILAGTLVVVGGRLLF